MSRIPGRRIEEIIELHASHGKSLQEVYVEGSEDKYFYESFLRAKGLSHVSVLEINTVEVPTKEVIDLGHNDGNRGRVITLARLLQDRVKLDEVVCIADADFDYCKGITHSYPLLLVTDGTSIDVYALDISVIDKLLGHLGGFNKPAVQVVGELDGLLKESFLMRVAASELGLEGQFPKTYSSFCCIRGGAFQFRANDYSSHAFSCSIDQNWRQKLGEAIEEKRPTIPDDPKKRIHGHDFRETLAWYIRQHPPHGALNPHTLSKLFLALIDVVTLEQQPLFVELLKRLS